jgi:hypothetical protein
MVWLCLTIDFEDVGCDVVSLKRFLWAVLRFTWHNRDLLNEIFGKIHFDPLPSGLSCTVADQGAPLSAFLDGLCVSLLDSHISGRAHAGRVAGPGARRRRDSYVSWELSWGTRTIPG